VELPIEFGESAIQFRIKPFQLTCGSALGLFGSSNLAISCVLKCYFEVVEPLHFDPRLLHQQLCLQRRNLVRGRSLLEKLVGGENITS
ncbi:hypothetical protein HPP92_021022, partial [Vanilla planifolia]